MLRAAELFNSKDKGNNLYYVCDPEENGEYMYVGFLQRSKNPNDLCMPCCFKKDPIESTNKSKRDYYLKCMGKIDNVEEVKTKIKTDKIYILQDTNKIQEGRFSFLPDILDKFLNKVEDTDTKDVKTPLLEENDCEKAEELLSQTKNTVLQTKTTPYLLYFSWLLVCIPLLFGISITIQKTFLIFKV
mgnify:CR=1 FL=1